MRFRPMRTFLLGLTLTIAAAGVARADCEADMLQLEDAMKTPNQTPAVTAAFKDAADKAASAMRKDDDAACHKAIADGLGAAGRTLK